MKATSCMEIFLIKILSVSFILALTGYDCGKGTPNMTTFSLIDVERCRMEDIEPELKPVYLQLLQRIQYDTTKVYQCRIKAERRIRYCSSFSPAWVALNGESVDMKPMNKEMCVELVQFGQFKFGETLVSDIKMNETTWRSVTVAGTSKESGECNGVYFITEGHEYQNVVVTIKLEITVFNFVVHSEKSKNVIALPSGTRCAYNQGHCMDLDENHYYWEVEHSSICKFDEYLILFEGPGVKVADNTSTSPDVYFGNSSTGVQFGLAKSGEEMLCGYKLISTEYPSFFIFETAEGRSFTDKRVADAEEILLSAYFNTKIADLNRYVKSQFKSLYKDIVFHRCNLERQLIIDSISQIDHRPDEFAFILMKQPGYHAVTAGEAVHVMQCQPISCKIRRIEDCYKELPVTCGEQVGFLKAKTRIFVSKGTIRDCNSLLPTMFNLGETWYRLAPVAVETKAPHAIKPMARLNWKYIDINNLVENGIYAHEDLENLNEHTMFPVEKQAIFEAVARKIVLKSIPTDSYNLNNLIDAKTCPSLNETESNSSILLTAGFLKFANISTDVIVAIIIVQFCKLILDFIMRGYTLYSVYGWNMRILGAVWDSLAYFFLLKGLPQKPAPAAQHVSTSRNSEMRTPPRGRAAERENVYFTSSSSTSSRVHNSERDN